MNGDIGSAIFEDKGHTRNVAGKDKLGQPEDPARFSMSS